MVRQSRSPQPRKAELTDLSSLIALEEECFDSDRLSRRSFRHWIRSEYGELWLIEEGGQLIAYGLAWCHRGTRLARLYSIAVHPKARGMGLAKLLLLHLEDRAEQRGYLYMRLEVAKQNRSAIDLYERNGYHIFGEYTDYYDDHSDALRMQKTIRSMDRSQPFRVTQWYPQSTPFTCGPSALMMAMGSLDTEVQLTQELELDIWREATTIFMTSGHGGCHPFGLALSAQKRGFKVELYVNTPGPLFLDGVRSAEKKQVLNLVHEQFLQEVNTNAAIQLNYLEVSPELLQKKLQEGCSVLVLISTYRLDRRKAPHWVVLTHVDDDCFYVHDPDIDTDIQQALDCQHMPIAKADFKKMASYGSGRLNTAVVLSPPEKSARS